ncbi:MAG: gamma-glutamyltransferase [Cellvibrionales bacterium]|nr:gamma-glutamyltransferase [Cellvibrionales bacterium]
MPTPNRRQIQPATARLCPTPAARLVAAALLALCAGTLQAQPIFDRGARFHPVQAPPGKGMVVSQDRLASEVGARILARGGNAIDAAVATGFALAVTFPQAGNLGGGGFMLVYLAESDQYHALDYRETAPASAQADMYVTAAGTIDTRKKRYGIESVAVPGTVAGLLHAHQKWGRLSRRQVLWPAIRLATKGFIISDSLAYSLQRAAPRLQTATTKAYFLDRDGNARPPGTHWRQPDLARTLRRIARHGRAGFYQGDTAQKIIDQVTKLGGQLTAQDLRDYRSLERPPLIATYRGHQIIAMPPPSSGGVHLIQMLNMLENIDLANLEHNSADYLHYLIEAMKPAYADRSLHLGDPDFTPVPVAQLTAKDYAAKLWKEIDPARARPAAQIRPTQFALNTTESHDTTHYGVWDAEGNVVSNTYTLNFSYGNGIAVAGAGFLLNNQMDDFTAQPGTANAYGLPGGTANAIAPGKRPLSSMAPTIVARNGTPILATGSPGGPTIITAVLQSILNVVDFQMNAAEAATAPRLHHQWQPDRILWEPGIPADTRQILKSRGHPFAPTPRPFGKLQLIAHHNDRLQGSTDPRWPGGSAAVQPAK